MNAQQERALKNACRFAFETMNPKFAYNTDTVHVLLTVASGYE